MANLPHTVQHEEEEGEVDYEEGHYVDGVEDEVVVLGIPIVHCFEDEVKVRMLVILIYFAAQALLGLMHWYQSLYVGEN